MCSSVNSFPFTCSLGKSKLNWIAGQTNLRVIIHCNRNFPLSLGACEIQFNSDKNESLFLGNYYARCIAGIEQYCSESVKITTNDKIRGLRYIEGWRENGKNNFQSSAKR